ncbi:hypothetical protein BN1058_02131 [Paraliobacillus sp. PM-2]|uniref:DUF3397 family protein n=1 Tax=Paraliobacillus sp. PM-2 TaxID=1462524 RepID=UPI00061C557C|nr:DUF3397 family protein [Paraliobacillus sp. PM-2]CQR47801.1 hypothetical protein BN1058_02131 [Paraliobacillus sp. PM-2]
MIQTLGIIIAMVITFPLIATMGVYIFVKLLYHNNKRALHASVAYSTLFYIVSVMMMLRQLFDTTYFGLIIVLLLSGLMASIIIQWKLTDNIIIKRAWKVFWRASFLFFFFSHFTLALVGIIITAMHA